MSDIIIIGGGGHAKVVISILRKINQYNIIGYSSLTDEGDILGVKYLGKDKNVVDDKRYKGLNVAIGIGQIDNLHIRKKIIKLYLDSGFEFPVIISPNAIINENVNIENGTVVMDGVVINSYTSIGKFCIINTGSNIDHDCNINNYVHIAPGSTLSGEVNVEKGVFIGAGTTIVNSINIGQNCFIGAGALVAKDCCKNKRYFGSPARGIENV